jgi:hypothetical protein
MTLHLGYPTVTQGHWLTGLTPIARPNNNRSHPYSQNQTELTGLTPVAKTIQTQLLTRPKTTITLMTVSTTIMTVYTLQRLHNITHRLVISSLAKRLEVSILPNVHFLWCTARRSPQSFTQRFPTRKTSTLKFHRCRLHHPTEDPSCAKARITPSITEGRDYTILSFYLEHPRNWETTCYLTKPTHISLVLYAVHMVTRSTNRSLGSQADTTTITVHNKYSSIPAPSSIILLLGSPRLTNSTNMLTNSHG